MREDLLATQAQLDERSMSGAGVRTRANLTHSSSQVRSKGVASPYRLCPVRARSGAVADDQTMIRRITVLIGS